RESAGTRLGTRVGDPGARRRWFAGQVDQGRHADSAQRLPPAQASEGLTDALYGCELQTVPSRRNEAVPEGDEVLHREVPRRASSDAAGTARRLDRPSSQDVGVLEAAP